MAAYVVIRVLGQADVNYNIQHTMHLLGLNRVNHATVVPVNDAYKGMLQVVKDYCTFGLIDEETLAAMIKARGKVVGDAPVTDEYVKEHTEFATIDDLAKAIVAGEYKIKDVEGMKAVFRLHPPIKGYEGNKHAFAEGGALGNRKEKINDLVMRML